MNYFIGICWIALLFEESCVNGDFVGCRKPAPPPCCPSTCPRCIPVSKRNRPEIGRRESLPVSIHRRNQKLRKANRLPGQAKLLDEQDFWRVEDWTIPKGPCNGPDCACANCVCCYTETVLYSTTTTCTATKTTTVFSTSTFTSFFGLTSLISSTNYIRFTVTDSFEYINTLTITVTDESHPIQAILQATETDILLQTLHLKTETSFGAVGIAYATLPGGPTVTRTRLTTITSFITSSIASPYTVQGTLTIETGTTASLITYSIFKCNPYETFTVSDILTVTPISTQTFYETPLDTFVDFTATRTSTETGTMTMTKCTGCTTVKYTPVKTFTTDILRTPLPERKQPGCQACGGS